MQVQMFKLKEIKDERGTLCVADFSDDILPFKIRRAFWIYNVPHEKHRGEHAHRTCAELLIPIQGSFTAHVITAHKEEMIFNMKNRSEALFIPPMTWCRFSNFSADSVCLCLASEDYQKEGYINDLTTFLKEISNTSD